MDIKNKSLFASQRLASGFAKFKMWWSNFLSQQGRPFHKDWWNCCNKLEITFAIKQQLRNDETLPNLIKEH